MAESTLDAARAALKAAVAQRAEISKLMANRSSETLELDRLIQRTEDALTQAEDAYQQLAATPDPRTITALRSANHERRKVRGQLDELKVIRKTLATFDDGNKSYAARQQLEDARCQFAAAYEEDQAAALVKNVEVLEAMTSAYAAWIWRGNVDDWGVFLGATIPKPTEAEVDQAYASFETHEAGPAMTLEGSE